MKDFIHVHSFTYDFHIRMVLNIIRGRTKLHGNLNLCDLLDQLWQRSEHPLNFIRNQICRGILNGCMTDKWTDRQTDNYLFLFTDAITISLSVTLESLYKHIITHYN